MFEFLKLKKNFKLFQKKDHNKKKYKENEKKNKNNSGPVDLSSARCSHDDSADMSPDLEKNSLLFGFVESPEIPKNCTDLNNSYQNFIECALDYQKKNTTELSILDKSQCEKNDILNFSKDGFSGKDSSLDKTTLQIENSKSYIFQSLCSITSPIHMAQCKTTPIDTDNPKFLSKFPSANWNNDDLLHGYKYENMIFESAYNDYVSIIRGDWDNSNRDNLECLENFLDTYQNELYHEVELKDNTLFSDYIFAGKKGKHFRGGEKFKHEHHLDFDDPVYLSRFASGYQANSEELYPKSLNLDLKSKYKNLIFESEYNDYLSFIREENNRIRRYKKSTSLQELFGIGNFLDPWKSSRSRDAKSVPRVQTRYFFPLNASASRICRPKCNSLGNLRFLDKKFSIIRHPDFSRDENQSKIQDQNESNRLQRSYIETLLKPGYGQSGKINKPKMEPFFIPLMQITPNSSMLREDGSGLDKSFGKDLTKNYTVYSYDLLRSSPKKVLPSNVDRKNLERHLSEQEFQQIFDMNYSQFGQLPDWKQVELKKIVKLF